MSFIGIDDMIKETKERIVKVVITISLSIGLVFN